MRFIVAAVLLAVALPATAQAKPPDATTLPAADVQQLTATLVGRVNPRGNPTAVFFRYGPTTAYGAETPAIDAGDGTDPRRFTAAITGLTPDTRIHYRVLARYGEKLVRGKDLVFRTRRQPLGLTLRSDPSSIRAFGETTLSGVLAGTGNEGRKVELLANPAPYAGFQPVGNPQEVGMTGAFSFPLLDVPVNTTYQVRIPGKPEVVSPIVFVGVRTAVSTKVRRLRRKRYRFTGRLDPGTAAKITVQRRKRGRWKDVESDITEQGRFRVRVLIRRRGRFRVLAEDLTNTYVPNFGRTVRVRPNRR